MTFIQKLEELCSEKGISKRTLEKEAGLGGGSTSKWKDNLPSQTSLLKLSNYFGVSIAYLTGDSEYRTKEEMFAAWDEKYNKDGKLAKEVKKIEEGTRIPVAGDVAAGIPIEAIEDIIDYEEIPLEMAKSGKFFGLRIKGDSMYPRIIEGDIVIVRQQEDADSGDIVIAKVNGNEATCKKLIKNEDGITLQPFNPNFDPMYFSNEDIINKPVCIIGKVVENRQKY